MKFLGWVIALPFIVLALYTAARFVKCRPDGEVVRVATPMVEKIADYIVEHGVPESLANIPGLPYELEGCSKHIQYEKNGEILAMAEEKYKVIYWSCYFFVYGSQYSLNMSYDEWFKRTTIRVSNKEKNTGLGAQLKKNDSDVFEIEYIGSGYILFHRGICSQFKQ